MHWHDFDSVLYATGGELTVWVDGEDEPVSCRRSAKIVASAGTLHKEQTPGHSAITGFSVMPESITQPVNKSPPVAIQRSNRWPSVTANETKVFE